jgi:hypothetical protein
MLNINDTSKCRVCAAEEREHFMDGAATPPDLRVLQKW